MLASDRVPPFLGGVIFDISLMMKTKSDREEVLL